MDFPIPREFDIALFFERLWLLLNDPGKSHILRWRENKHKFFILRDQLMILEICPLLYRYCTWANFLQTLYACKFRRGRDYLLEFYHEVFSQRRLQAMTREERYELFRNELGYKPSRLTNRNLSETWEEWLGPDIHIRPIRNAAGNVQVSIVTPVVGTPIPSTSGGGNSQRPRVRKNSDPRRYEGEDEIIDVWTISSEESNSELPRNTLTQQRSPSGSSTLISEPHATSDNESNPNQPNDGNTESSEQTTANVEGQEGDEVDNNSEESSGEESGNTVQESANNNAEESSAEESVASTEQESAVNNSEESSGGESVASTVQESADNNAEESLDEESTNNEELLVSGSNSGQESSNNNDQDQSDTNSDEESTNQGSNNDGQGERSATDEESSNQESNNDGEDQDEGPGDNSDEESTSDSSDSDDDSSDEDDNDEEPRATAEKPRRPRKPETPTKYRRGNQPDCSQPSTSAGHYDPGPSTSAEADKREAQREPIILRIPKHVLKKYKKKKSKRDK